MELSTVILMLVGWLMQIVLFGLGTWMLKGIVKLQQLQAAADERQEASDKRHKRMQVELDRLTDYPALEQRTSDIERRVHNLEERH